MIGANRIQSAPKNAPVDSVMLLTIKKAIILAISIKNGFLSSEFFKSLNNKIQAQIKTEIKKAVPIIPVWIKE